MNYFLSSFLAALAVFFQTGSLSAQPLPVKTHPASSQTARSSSPSTIPFGLSDRLFAGNVSALDEFGWSVAIDGNTAVIGDEGEDVGSNTRQGAAFVFERMNGLWVFQQRITAPDGAAGDGLGVSVDIDADTIAISTRSGGKVYIFSRGGSGWLFQAEFNSSDVEFFVNPVVSLSGDNLLVGCTNGNGVAVGSGTAYVFVRRGFSWSFQAELNASDGVQFDNFGAGIAISGNTALVGAFADDLTPFNDNRGSAYVFTRNGSVWTQTDKLIGTPATMGFGISCALNEDRALVGASITPAASGFSQGAAYIFTRNAGAWSEPAELRVDDDPSSGNFGLRVALSGDTALIAAPKSDIGTNVAQGAAYIFINAGGSWVRTAKLVAPDGAKYDNFGRGAALYGNTALLGANGDNFFGNTAPGAVYVFSDVSGEAPDLEAAHDTGFSNSDNITKSTDPSFVINNVTTGARVELIRNNVVVDSAVATGPSITLKDHITVDGDYGYNWHEIVGDVTSSRSSALLLTLDTAGPAVTINKALGQPDPSTSSVVTFIVNVNDPLNDFTLQDVSLAGSTADISGVTISGGGDGSAFGVQINNIVSNGQMVRGTVPAGAFTDVAGNGNMASTTADNEIIIDNVHPRVTIDQAANQPDPTNSLPLNFTVVFSEPVTNFTASDFSFAGSTINTSNLGITLTGSGATYNVVITGSTVSATGILRLSVPSGAAFDWLGNGSDSSTSTDNEITIDRIAPAVTLDQAPGQADPTSSQPVRLRAVFSEPVTGLSAAGISLAGSTAGVSAAAISITGSGATYDIAVSNISSGGQLRVSISSGAARDAALNASTPSASSDNVVTLTLASSGNVAGRVVNSLGRGVFYARVTVTLDDGTKLYAITNPFGYFKFVNVPTGSVTIEASRKAQQGAPRPIFLTGDLSDLDLTVQYN